PADRDAAARSAAPKPAAGAARPLQFPRDGTAVRHRAVHRLRRAARRRQDRQPVGEESAWRNFDASRSRARLNFCAAGGARHPRLCHHDNDINKTIRRHMTAATQFEDIRDGVRSLCQQFPQEYFRKIDEQRAYPEAFVDALTKAGWMAALIPQEYGGSGLSLTEASVIMEEVNRAGGNSGACHGQMYNMNTLLRHGSETQRQTYLPRIATGELRLQAM